PLVIHQCAQIELRDKDGALRQQAGQLGQSRAENERLSNLAAQVKPGQRLSAEQLRELLRLRSQVNELRRQTNSLQNIREENLRLQAGPATGKSDQVQRSQAEIEKELPAEIMEAMKSICRELRPALQRFAKDHTNQAPTSLGELRNYFPTLGGHKM